MRYACSLPPMIVCHFILSLRQIQPAGSSWIENPSHSLPFIGNIGQSLQFSTKDAGGEGEALKIEAVSAQTKFSSGCAIGAVAETAKANKESRYSMGELEAQPVSSFLSF